MREERKRIYPLPPPPVSPRKKKNVCTRYFFSNVTLYAYDTTLLVFYDNIYDMIKCIYRKKYVKRTNVKSKKNIIFLNPTYYILWCDHL